jgi:adenylate cyclase
VISRIAGLGADPRDDAETRRKKALAVATTVLILPVSLAWSGLYLALGAWGGYLALLYFAVSLALLAVFARTHRFHPFLAGELLILVLTTAVGQMVVGGFLASGGVALWGILAPLGALVFLEVRQAIGWFVGFVLVFVLTGVAGELWFPDDLPRWFATTMLALNIVVAGSLAFALLASFAHQLRAEREKSEALLLNVLPRAIADRLKLGPQGIADHFPEASILFADVVDFTPLAQRLSPTEMVGILNQLFTEFDALVERHGLEKIKTIGDCYMAAAGVPSPRPDHACTAAHAALEMRDAVTEHAGVRLRIGINSGPVVAGVIGAKRFLYDLWGDAVNTASRMESHGTPGEIQITRATYELVKDEFVCRPRGTIDVKGLGPMETWYLVGPIMASPSNGGAP